MQTLEKLQFFTSSPYQCGYLPEQNSVTAFADPDISMSTALYSLLADRGFRRSGSHVYRPHCPTCSACIATRVVASDFTPGRSHRRNIDSNQNLNAVIQPAECNDEIFDLYRRYQAHRHAGGPMDNPSEQSFREFLTCSWADSGFVEFRDGHKLVSIAAIDFLADGISAVYTFFDPEYSRRGLGTYAILWQLNEALNRGLRYVYLGYWIGENSKMSYKTRFQPIEGFINGRWQRLDISGIPVSSA